MSATPRVVLVTGASSGIGRVTARALARRGDHVVLAARAAESLLAAERECAAEDGSTLVVPTDITDAAAVDALFDAAVARFGRVDAVVHSVAVVAYGRFEDVPGPVFDQVVGSLVTGTANVARVALGRFRAQGDGRLVVVGSLLGKVATPLMSSYVAGKWAVHGLVRTLQVEARETPGVEVSLVTPGSVDTPVYRQAASYLGRTGRPPPPVDPPEKVARAVLSALDRPRREISVGVANPFIVLGFRAAPAVFDALVLPLMRVGGLSRQPSPATDGNVLAPRPDGDAAHGRWGRHWLRGATAAAIGAGAGATVLRYRGRRPMTISRCGVPPGREPRLRRWVA
jgi:NAD(P)-dependent dehydrogenase (short-subunit alcohol dehydrogenase family)